MDSGLELSISDMSEIEAMELQNAIDERSSTPQPMNLSSEHLRESTSGDPGLVQALLTYAPQAIPVLASAVAAWIVAGRKNKTRQDRELKITRRGIVYRSLKISDLEREASGKPLEQTLEKLLAGRDDNAEE